MPAHVAHFSARSDQNITAGAFTAGSVGGNIYVQGHEDEMLFEDVSAQRLLFRNQSNKPVCDCGTSGQRARKRSPFSP